MCIVYRGRTLRLNRQLQLRACAPDSLRHVEGAVGVYDVAGTVIEAVAHQLVQVVSTYVAVPEQLITQSMLLVTEHADLCYLGPHVREVGEESVPQRDGVACVAVSRQPLSSPAAAYNSAATVRRESVVTPPLSYCMNPKLRCSSPTVASSRAPLDLYQFGRKIMPSIPPSAISLTSRDNRSPHVIDSLAAWPSGEARA